MKTERTTDEFWRESAFEAIGLSIEYRQIIEQESLGLMSMYEFEQWIPSVQEEAFLLCLDKPKGRMEQLGEKYHVIEFSFGLEYFRIDKTQGFSDILKDYLQQVISSGKPIIFFLPAKIMNHEYANVTRFELFFLMQPENRGVLGRVQFVFDEDV